VLSEIYHLIYGSSIDQQVKIIISRCIR